MSNSDRIKQIKMFLNDSPHDEFMNYALATEYIAIGHDQEALELFEKLVSMSPLYFATYYHLGKLHEKMGNTGSAISIYEKGLSVTKKLNENHAYAELKGAYDALIY